MALSRCGCYPCLLLLCCTACVCLAGVIRSDGRDADAVVFKGMKMLINEPFLGAAGGATRPGAVGFPERAPGGERALERVPVVASAAALGPQPALGAPAAPLRDGQPAAPERPRGLVALHPLVVTDEAGDIPVTRREAEEEENDDKAKHGDVAVIFLEDESMPLEKGTSNNKTTESLEERDRKRKVSNIRPKTKPMLSDALLPGVVQVLIHLVDRLQGEEQKLQPEETAPGTPIGLPEETSAAKPESSESPVIAIVQLVQSSQPSSTPGLIIELQPPNKGTTNSSSPADVNLGDRPANDDTDDADLMTEGTPVVQNDVPVVSEETVPMMFDMVPSDTPEMMLPAFIGKVVDAAADDDAEHDPTALKEGSSSMDASGERRKREIEDVDTDLYPSEPHRYVYYPTLFFTDEFNKNPGSDVGFLGYKETVGSKDHVDLESDGDSTRDAVEDEYESLKDDALPSEENRGDPQPTPKRFKPSRELLKIAKLRYALSLDAKRQKYKKFQGYTDRVVSLLEMTSTLTSREQLGVLLAEVIHRGEIKTDKALEQAKNILEDLEKPDSALSKVLEDIPALNYASV